MTVLTTKFNRDLSSQLYGPVTFWEEMNSLGKEAGMYHREAKLPIHVFFQSLALYLKLNLQGRFPVFGF